MYAQEDTRNQQDSGAELAIVCQTRLSARSGNLDEVVKGCRSIGRGNWFTDLYRASTSRPAPGQRVCPESIGLVYGNIDVIGNLAAA